MRATDYLVEDFGGRVPVYLARKSLTQGEAMHVSADGWLALLGFAAARLIIYLLHRSHQELKFVEVALWSSIWVACGIAVGGVNWFLSGSDFALQYYSSYFIE